MYEQEKYEYEVVRCILHKDCLEFTYFAESNCEIVGIEMYANELCTVQEEFLTNDMFTRMNIQSIRGGETFRQDVSLLDIKPLEAGEKFVVRLVDWGRSPELCITLLIKNHEPPRYNVGNFQSTTMTIDADLLHKNKAYLDVTYRNIFNFTEAKLCLNILKDLTDRNGVVILRIKSPMYLGVSVEGCYEIIGGGE